MSADDDLLRARMRRDDLEDELLEIEKEIAAVRDRGRDTMGILAPDDNIRLHQLLDRRDGVQKELSEARSEERFLRKKAEQPRDLQAAQSLTDWKKQRDPERPGPEPLVDRGRVLEPDPDRDR